MSAILAGTLLLLGAFFVLVSAIGILRFPDLYMRMHGATKAGTLGAGLILLGASVLFGTLAVTVKAMTVFVFLLLTAPVAAHVLGRAAHHDDVPKWDRTGVDELEGRYDRGNPEHDGPAGMTPKG
ncbi:MAG: monovalent cation/H(+) antiporter subunit G [Trueperaceae bacterium]|nr:monovalent cation/H(+) antiporter subunit G [Trueperaceae bacterium]